MLTGLPVKLHSGRFSREVTFYVRSNPTLVLAFGRSGVYETLRSPDRFVRVKGDETQGPSTRQSCDRSPTQRGPEGHPESVTVTPLLSLHSYKVRGLG